MRNSLKKLFQILTAIACLTSGSAVAQSGFGVRGGYTDDDPTQAHVGAHYKSKPFLGNVTFRPNIEFGFGKNAKTIASNFEFVYKYADFDRSWSGYAGAGPAINVYRYTPGAPLENNTKLGANIVLGLDHINGFFIEAKVGPKNSPVFKLTAGYTFGKKE
jgi:hypothetical protein